MQHMLLRVHEVTEQCVIVVLDELSCRWPVSRADTGPDSTTDDSFDAMSIICRREAAPGTERVEQFGDNDGFVYSLQCLVVHAVAAQHTKSFGDWLDSNEGTSAGTRLGPLLFIMYIHDVPKCIAPKFADDLASVAIEKDVDSVREQLHYAVGQLVDWSRENDMVLNASKTCLLYTSPSPRDGLLSRTVSELLFTFLTLCVFDYYC